MSEIKNQEFRLYITDFSMILARLSPFNGRWVPLTNPRRREKIFSEETTSISLFKSVFCKNAHKYFIDTLQWLR